MMEAFEKVVVMFPRTCMVIHFVLVEMRCLLLVFISIRSLILSFHTKFLLAHEKPDYFLDICEQENGSCPNLMQLIEQVRVGVAHNMVSLDPHVVFPGELIDYNYNSTNGYAPAVRGCSAFHYASLFCTMAFSMLLIAKAIRTGATDFATGRYLAWTWKIRSKWWYRYPILICLANTAVVLGCCAVFAKRPEICEWVANFSSPDHVYYCNAVAPALHDVIASSYIEWGLTLCGFVGALTSKPPGFNWQNKIFEKIRFKRSFMSVLLESNDAFGDRLANVCAKASKSDLSEMLLDEMDVQYFLKFRWDSEDDGRLDGAPGQPESDTAEEAAGLHVQSHRFPRNWAPNEPESDTVESTSEEGANPLVSN